MQDVLRKLTVCTGKWILLASELKKKSPGNANMNERERNMGA
jgi:hypothetical protein